MFEMTCELVIGCLKSALRIAAYHSHICTIYEVGEEGSIGFHLHGNTLPDGR